MERKKIIATVCQIVKLATCLTLVRRRPLLRPLAPYIPAYRRVLAAAVLVGGPGYVLDFTHM